MRTAGKYACFFTYNYLSASCKRGIFKDSQKQTQFDNICRFNGIPAWKLHIELTAMQLSLLEHFLSTIYTMH